MKPNTARPCRHRSSSDMGTRGGDQRRGETRGERGEREGIEEPGRGERRDTGETRGREPRRGAEDRGEREEGSRGSGKRELRVRLREGRARLVSGAPQRGPGQEAQRPARWWVRISSGPGLCGSGSQWWVRVSVVGPGLSGGSGSQW
ncbi:putative aspartate/prephenate aminotransferase [Dissostichus eleginoides]|uniref:Aspartate/prephenate aminotransferase n=1 Tax=Dissostichus eleginoides TaxID=100907 RepID=A0AAD9BIL9_DISEL|nr:putative aspartate/prephenate aminotransferase [Dissostichus eleginoides]